MNILISAPSYPSKKSPLASFIGVIAHEFSRLGINVTVIAPQSITRCLKHHIPIEKYHYIDIFEDKPIDVFRPYSLSFGHGQISHTIDRTVTGITLKKMHKKFDLVYSHFWSSADNVLNYAKNNHIPMIVATGEHQINILNQIPASRVKELNEYTKGVIGVSTKNIIESMDEGLLTTNPYVVLPNSIDDSMFKIINNASLKINLEKSPDDFIVAFCGRFCNRKGLNRLDQALSEINNPHIKAIYIGNFSEGERFNLNYNNIIFCGSLPHTDIPLYLNSSDIFVLPTLAEGCSNSIVEAMACGLPIVSSAMDFNYDILDNETSILIDPMDINQIKDAILDLYNDRTKLNEMRQVCIDKSKDLTIRKRAERIISFINKVAF